MTEDIQPLKRDPGQSGLQKREYNNGIGKHCQTGKPDIYNHIIPAPDQDKQKDCRDNTDYVVSDDYGLHLFNAGKKPACIQKCTHYIENIYGKYIPVFRTKRNCAKDY
jgi:hypothetical protein